MRASLPGLSRMIPEVRQELFLRGFNGSSQRCWQTSMIMDAIR
jgi:hypothetical protein